ncbi:Zinc finger C2HC domain-containing protein 1A [Lucilia cuprina]|nr:Zinc finger C2HC domain-containing protein 1A [Lucilia cuprina]
MSKKMWNKIFKSKTNKNSKSLQAANKINKRSSIYEEYQQLNAALDNVPINEKFKENSNAPPIEKLLLNDGDKTATAQPTKIPQTNAFSKVVNTLTLKRSQNSNSNKDLKNNNNEGKEGKEKAGKKSELEIKKTKSCASLATSSETTSPNDKAINQSTINNYNSSCSSSTDFSPNNCLNSSVKPDQCSNSNSNVNTPYQTNQQQLTATASSTTTNATETTSAASLNLKLNNKNINNNNNNEYLACKQNLTNPIQQQQQQQQQKRLSKIVIVVKKFDASTATTTEATSLTSSSTPTSESNIKNLHNHQFTIDCTNNSFTNHDLKNSNNSNKVLETSFLLTAPTKTPPPPPTAQRSPTSLSSTETLQIFATCNKLNDQNQLSRNLSNVIVNQPNDVDHHQQQQQQQLHHLNSDYRKLGFKVFDNGNNITTPTEEPDASLELVPCPICSRTFNPVTLRKHVGICEKMTTKKRNIFDSSRQRREGTDLATYPLPKNFGLPEKATSSTSITAARNERGQSPKPAAQISSPNLTRKKPSEDLIRSTARASMRKAVSTNNNTTPTSTTAASTNFNRDRMRSSERSLTRSRGIQPPPAEQCPHCERCFGIKAYDRHVEWCKEKALQAAIKQGSSKNDGNVAKARLEARTKYRAPCLKTKRSMNREKYSGLAGEEHENDDTTKTSKTNGSKTQDNSLMSMSMTSSMCSERKITNSTTAAKLNEPQETATYKEHTNIDNCSVGSRKCTRDKSQTPQLPPTTTKKMNAVAKATTEYKQQKQEESIINLKIQMPELQLMGEQMTAIAINKKLKVDALTAANIKPQKPKQLQQQQQLPDFKKHQQKATKKSNQKLKTTDVEINLPVITSNISLEQKKSVSDLSLKTMRRRVNCLQAAAEETAHKAFVNDHDNHVVNNNVLNHYEMKSKEKSEKLWPVGGNKDDKESERKMTMEQYFEREEQVLSLDKHTTFKREEREGDIGFSLPKKLTEMEMLDSEKIVKTREKDSTNPIGDLCPLEEHQQSTDLLREQDLTMKQTYPDCDRDSDSEDAVNEILNSIPKLDIPTTPIKSLKKQKHLSEDVKKCSGKSTESEKRDKLKKSLRETETKDSKVNENQINNTKSDGNLNSSKQSLKNSEEEKDALEMEIYKDCLTDSDELRRFQPKESKKDDLETLTDSKVDDDNSAELDLKILKSSFKSHTFIRDLKQTSYQLKEFKDDSGQNKQKPLKYSKSSEDLCGIKTNPQNSTSPIKRNTKSQSKHLKESPGTPRTPKALRLPRLGTPPPAQLSRTAPTTPKSETSERLKSLNICPTKRKKVLRQTVSCSNSLPMKAVLPFPNDTLKLCGVISAPQLKSIGLKENNVNESVRVEKLEYNEENNIDFMKDEEEKEEEHKEIKVIKEPPLMPQLKRNKSFTVSGLPDNYDPFLSAKRQLEELCSPTNDSADISTTPQTPQLPSLPATPNSNNNNNNSSISKMSTSLILSSSTPNNTNNTTPNLMTTSQIPQQTQKTPTLARSSSFRRTSSLRGPRRSPMLSTRPPLFAQKHRPTIQRGLSDEGPISTNFLKPEEYDEMPVRSVCVNDFAVNKSPRVVRRDTSASNRKQPLKLNINAANASGSSAAASPNTMEAEVVASNSTASKYVSKTDSLAVFLKYEHELEKLNQTAADNELKKETILEVKTPSTADSITTTPVANLDGPLNAKELKDKSNNLSKQNSAKNIKADILAGPECNEVNVKNTNEMEINKYGQQRLTPLSSKPATPLSKPQTPQVLQQPTASLTPLNVKTNVEQKSAPKSPKPVALSSIFGGDNNKTVKNSSHLYAERKNSMGSDYIDPKLINKCDNLPINLNLKRTDFKHSDSDTSETRVEQFSSSSSSDSAAPAKKTTTATSLQQHTKFLPTVKQQQQQQPEQHHIPQQQQQQPLNNSQRNSAEGRNLLKRRIRLGRNQFLYDASPEGDSCCSADDEGANRSSLEGETLLQHNLLREHEKAFERLTSQQVNPVDAPFIPPLPAFDDFDFEEFLSSFENDEEQFPLFKDCREFLMNRTSKKQRSMLMTNSATQNQNNTHSNTHNIHNSNNNNNNSTNFKKSSSPQTFPPLTPQTHTSGSGQHFQFPSLPQHPKNLFNSFSLNTRSRNKYDELTATTSNTKSTDTFCLNTNTEQFKDHNSLNQKREIFISIETEQNDLDKSPISPNSIRHMVGNPQTVVEVEVDAAHDNKFSKISDDDEGGELGQNMCRTKNFSAHSMLERLPNVQLNNAKNLMQKMQEDFRQMGDEMAGNLRLTTTAPMDVNMNSKVNMMAATRKTNRTAGTPSGDAYGDSDELSSLDGYPLSSPNSRLGVSSKTSADSAYGSLSRQRSSELTNQRNSNRSRPLTSNTANCLLNRPLTEESSLGRSRQLSASSSSSSEHALPPLTNSNSFHKQQQQQQQLYNNNNNNTDLEELRRYERHSNNNNNNYDLPPSHVSLTGATNSHTNLETLQQYPSNSTMSSSMKVSKFCHECGSRFLLEQAKFCMDCGVKRIVL